MKYIINYNEQGKILGFAKGVTDLNKEVSNAIWFEAQSFNKIIIDGKNISFDKVDWRTVEEIEAQLQEQANAEARAMLNGLDWKVIRELERLMLTGTDLNLEREELRASVV